MRLVTLLPAAALALHLAGCDPSPRRLERYGPTASAVASAASLAACGWGEWTTYGQNPARTSASPGCCRGPLKLLWSFRPPPKEPRQGQAQTLAVTHDSIYVTGTLGESPAVYRLGVDGKLDWTFDSRADIYRGHWPTVALGSVLVNDDGIYLLDPHTGKKKFDRWFDSWGQTLSDGKRFYWVSAWHVEGPRVLVGALDPTGQPQWSRNERGGVTREDAMDVIGGLALGGDTLFQTADFHFTNQAGVWAFDRKDGAPRWSQAVFPKSAPSTAAGKLFHAEGTKAGAATALVARRATDGAVAWTVPVDGTDGAAPVVADGLVVTLDAAGTVTARDIESGKAVWSSQGKPLPTARPDGALWVTSIAAAVGSGTLVAVDGRELVLRGLRDGKESWRGTVGNGGARLTNVVVAGGRVYVVADGVVNAVGCGGLGRAPP